MRLVYDASDFVVSWVAARIPHADRFGPAAGIGIATDDKLVGGMVYHDYQPDFQSVQLSMAAEHPMWARPHIVKGLLEYPFYQLDCFRVWTLTPLDGEAAIKTNVKVGFTKEATLAHAFGKGRHGVVCRMLKPDFIKKYGDQ